MSVKRDILWAEIIWDGSTRTPKGGSPSSVEYMKTNIEKRKIVKMYIKRPGVLTCGHCKNKGFMKILTGYSERNIETIKSPCGYLVFNAQHPWGVAYELAKCMSCNEITLTKIDWHDDSAPEDYTYTILYPSSHCP